MKTSIKLVISDLDGTLLGSDHQLSLETINTLQALHKTGIQFWIATGRHHQDALVIRNQIGFPIRMITANGATVSDLNGDLEHAYSLNKDVAQAILRLEIPIGVYANAYQGDAWLTEVPDKVFEDYYHPEGFRYTLCKFSERWETPLNKIFFTSLDHQQLLPLAKHIEMHFSDFVDTTFSMPQCLEIMPKGTNKGSAIHNLLQREGIAVQEVLAYGDGMNDLEMLTLVGHGHLLANANPKLIAALPNLPIIGHHHEHAVAKSLQSYFQL